MKIEWIQGYHVEHDIGCHIKHESEPEHIVPDIGGQDYKQELLVFDSPFPETKCDFSLTMSSFSKLPDDKQDSPSPVSAEDNRFTNIAQRKSQRCRRPTEKIIQSRDSTKLSLKSTSKTPRKVTPALTEMSKKHCCPICGKMISGIGMPLHRRKFHPEVKPFHCFQCPFQTMHSSSIYKHRRKAHYYPELRPGQIHGHLAQSQEKIPAALEATSRQGNTSERIAKLIESNRACESCDYVAGSVKELLKHLRTSHQQPAKNFGANSASSNSVNSAHSKANSTNSIDSNPPVCELCPYTATSTHDLQVHMKIRHPTQGVNLFKCANCPYVVASLAALLKHAHIHDNDLPLKCDYCTAGFKNNIGRSSHTRILHPEHYKRSSGERKKTVRKRGRPMKKSNAIQKKLKLERLNKSERCIQVCVVCGETFDLLGQYMKHLEMFHHETKPFKCKACKYQTVREKCLRRHEKACKEVVAACAVKSNNFMVSDVKIEIFGI